MPNYNEESIALHERTHGKLEVRSKVPLRSREDLSRAYTPGVAAVSTAIGKDRSLARAYTLKGNTVAVVSDGSAVLGLGNLGPEAAIPVMEGKAILFKAFAGIDAFPICLATQDPDEIVAAVTAIAPVFGGINLEDIAAPRCFEIERRLRDALDIPVFHDDQHGTATVVLAALINALKVKGLAAQDARVVVNGAGAAGTAIAQLLAGYGFTKLVVCDSRGIVASSRADLNPQKQRLAQATNPEGRRGGLCEALDGADVFVGVSAPGVLTGELIGRMAAGPIVFAMANPVPEIMPDAALAAGASIVATGRSDFPNQVNNVLAFPGIFRGALDHRVRRITDAMLITAAKNLAACVAAPTAQRILPDPFDPAVVPAVASAIQAR